MVVKLIVLCIRVASWESIPNAPVYSAAKHGLLGFMRSLQSYWGYEGIRFAIVHPWFAGVCRFCIDISDFSFTACIVDTNIVPAAFKLVLSGLPMVPVHRIAGSIFYSITEPDPATNGCPWMLLDGGPLLRLDREQLTEGVYEVMNQRLQKLFACVIDSCFPYTFDLRWHRLRVALTSMRDMSRILGRSIIMGDMSFFFGLSIFMLAVFGGIFIAVHAGMFSAL
jgi:short chain dehydrogenase